MTKEQFDFIEQSLHATFNTIFATKLYLEHQLSLHPMHRVIQEETEIIEDNLKLIKKQSNDYTKAIAEFKKAEAILVTSHQPY